jgi:hypothetical protein
LFFWRIIISLLEGSLCYPHLSLLEISKEKDRKDDLEEDEE